MQRLLDKMLGDALGSYAHGYVDDIIIYSKTLEEHLTHLAKVISRIKAYGLRIGLDKCEFFMSRIIFLGHVIEHGNLRIDPEKIKAASELPRPETKKELQKVLGFFGWMRRFILDYAMITACLTDMLALSEPDRLNWTPERIAAFNELRARVTSQPVLMQPDFSKRFFIDCDASNTGIGGVCSQQTDSNGTTVHRPVSFLSRKLTKAEVNYSTREREMLAILWCVEKLRDWLWGRPFTVYSDHKSLSWIKSAMLDHGRLSRWAFKLSAYEFDIVYKPGVENTVADCLSRAAINVIKFDRRRTDGKLTLRGSTVSDKAPKPSRTHRKRKRRLRDQGRAQQSTAITAISTKPLPPPARGRYLYPDPLPPAKLSEQAQPSAVLPIAIGTGAEAEHEDQDILDLQGRPEDLPGDSKGDPTDLDEAYGPVHPGPMAPAPLSSAPHAGSAPRGGDVKVEDPTIVADRGERKGPPVAPVPAGLEDKDENYPYRLPSIETWRNLMVHDLQYRTLILYMQGKYTPRSITQMDALKKAVGFYKLADGLLYYRLSRKDGKESELLVVPEVSRRIIVMLYHSHHLMGGHRGWKTAKAKIQQRYFWPNMNEDVKHYVGNCPECFWAKVKPNVKAGLMVDFLTNVGKFEVCHIDFVGPLPIVSQAGNRFILTMKCRGTGWIELMACPDQTALTAAKTLYSEWICKYGVPKVVISDRGAPFKSALMKCLSKFMLMDMRQTTSYHPQTNGALERDHKTLKMYLRSSCLGTPSTWDTFLPSFRFTMNTTARDRLSYSSYFLLFGCHPRLPGDNRQAVIEHLDTQVARMLTGLEEAGKIMLQERKENYVRLKMQYDKAHFALSYPIGAVVFK